ncbi:MAG TPA: STAS domain-containing protein [Vicinamibacterales bacterium]|nr:STAS domain-containing protein [Vicinamibacterales bacterium]
MSIALESRRVDDITIVSCTGRIVEGQESLDLRHHLDQILQFGPYLIVNLAGIDFVDSSGLGLLVRYTMRVRNASGVMKLCGLSSQLATILKATRLDGVFDIHATEDDAIAAFRARPQASTRPARATEILCVIGSMDLQAYVREILNQNGFGVLTASNVPDGLTLLQVTRPKVIVVDSSLERAAATHAAVKFKQLSASIHMVELPDDFAHQDAGAAAKTLLDRIGAANLR